MQNEKEFLRGFEEAFSELDDQRQQGKVAHPLLEVIFLSLMAVSGKAGDWREIELFGKSHLNAFRCYVTSGYKMIQRSGIKVIQQEVVYSLSKREVMTNVSIGASNGNKDFRSARQEFEADSF